MKIKLIIGVMLAVFLTGLFIAAGKVCALEPIKLGTVLPSNDLTGTESIKAMKLAIKQINASGGLLGRQVELVWADDEMKLDKAAPGLEKLVNVDKVDILIGGMASGSFTAMMPLMKKYQKVTVWNGVSSYKVEEAMAGQDWFFHIYPWDYQIWNNANVGWQQILQKHAGLKIKKVFMAYEDS
ncbi:MAG TPA: ABC transporter substrate-binding protein, partial [Smithellaceae bacterium]|nr:ABC transporter substrate-binding protein [Smithellaceae bacterium]